MATATTGATALTAEQIAERIAAAKAKRPAREKINNAGLVAEAQKEGIRILHILPFEDRTGKGMTVAFNHEPHKPVMEISTAVRKIGDVFSRKYGTRQAIGRYYDDNVVYIPVQKFRIWDASKQRDVLEYSPIDTLRACFC